MLIEESSRTEEGPPCLKTGARGCTGGEEEEEEDENEEEVSWALLVPVPMGLLRRRCYAGSKPYPRAVAVINRHLASTTHKHGYFPRRCRGEFSRTAYPTAPRHQYFFGPKDEARAAAMWARLEGPVASLGLCFVSREHFVEQGRRLWDAKARDIN